MFRYLCDLLTESTYRFSEAEKSGHHPLIYDIPFRGWGLHLYPFLMVCHEPLKSTETASLIHLQIVVDRPAMEMIRNLAPCTMVDQRPIGANAHSTVGTASDAAPLVCLLFSRVGKPSAGGSMAYSFNHPHGMWCPDYPGLEKGWS